MARFERQAVLAHCTPRFREGKRELAHSLCVVPGKLIRDAEGEVERLIDTFRIAAGEAVRIHGEIQPIDISPAAIAMAACGSACGSGGAASSRPSTSRSTSRRTR